MAGFPKSWLSLYPPNPTPKVCPQTFRKLGPDSRGPQTHRLLLLALGFPRLRDPEPIKRVPTRQVPIVQGTPSFKEGDLRPNAHLVDWPQIAAELRIFAKKWPLKSVSAQEVRLVLKGSRLSAQYMFLESGTIMFGTKLKAPENYGVPMRGGSRAGIP